MAEMEFSHDDCDSNEFLSETSEDTFCEDGFFIDSNNLAYTIEDKILISNLLAYNIPKNVNENELEIHFENFGEVKKCKLFTNVVDNLKNAFVIYKCPKVAAEVLLMYNSKNDKKIQKLSVKAHDSWRQPILDTMEKDAERIPKSQSISITDLNDDCLLCIIKCLDLKSQLAFALSDPQFKQIFKTFAKTNLKTVDRDMILTFETTWKKLSFFTIIGEYISELDIFVDDFRSLFKFVEFYCSNLTKLTIECDYDIVDIVSDDFNCILKNKTKLKGLHLKRCFIKDEFINFVRKLPELEDFTLAECNELKGDNFQYLTNLKKLNLIDCAGLESSKIEIAFSKMLNLSNLCIIDPSGTSQHCIENISNYCKNLEILHIYCPRMPLDSISNLEKLKSVYFEDYANLRCLNMLAQKRGNQIKSLGVHHELPLKLDQCQVISQFKNLEQLHCCVSNNECLRIISSLNNLVELKLCGSDITNNYLLQLVRSCRNLKWINLWKTDIDNNFAKELLTIIKQDKRPHRLVFLVYWTRMTKSLDFPEEYNTEEIKTLVEFVFERVTRINSYDKSKDLFDKHIPSGNSIFFHYTKDHFYDE